MGLYELLAMQLIFAAIMFFMPKNLKFLSPLHIAFNTVNLVFIMCLVLQTAGGIKFSAFENILVLDALGAVFLTLVGITGFLANTYATTYLKWEHEAGHINIGKIKNYYALSYVFIFTMSLSCVCNNMAVLWAAVEATTLASAFLVAVSSDRKSTESGYKYIILCSIGLAFALYATVLLYSSSYSVMSVSSDAMYFDTLIANAANLNPDVLKLVFIFALIGYGTKAGLVPTHTWLPDAHAQGPAPTSAMLSGILLKCAMLALIRFYAIAGQAIGFDFVENAMIVSGGLTLFVSAFFLIRQHDVKRMFAYHSIAHMGVIAFALGVGSILGVFAAIFHCMAHSFTKALAFCSTGNIARIYGTKDMHKMGGMMYIAPLTTVLFGISICSLVGVPGFAIFVSEFWTFKAAAATGQYLAIAVFFITLTIIFIADFSHFFMSSFGPVVGKVYYNKEMKLSENLPLIALATLIVAFGVYHFDWFMTLVDNAAMIVTGAQKGIL